MQGDDWVNKRGLLDKAGFSKKPCTGVQNCVNFTFCQPGHHGGDLQPWLSCIPCDAGNKNEHVASAGKSRLSSNITQKRKNSSAVVMASVFTLVNPFTPELKKYILPTF